MGLSTFEAFKNMNTNGNEYTHLEGELLRKFQFELLKIAEDIAKVCEENNIMYQLSGGSVLGAVRHKGFIPWDDDMDINIFGHHFEKFIKCFKEKYGHKYWIHTQDTPNYGMVIARVRLKGSVARMREDIDNDQCGFYVDILRIVDLYDNVILRKLHGVLCMGMGLLLSCRNFYKNRKFMRKLEKENPAIKKTFETKIFLGRLLSFMSLTRWTQLTQKCYSMCKNSKSKYVGIPSGRKHYFGEIYLRSKLGVNTKLSFEEKIFNVPKDYDYYLTKLYGDYMWIPPVDQRETHILMELKFPKES